MSDEEKLSLEDINMLEFAKLQRKLVLAAAEKAASDNNAAEWAFKYTVLQLYMKYNLTAADAIDEQGVIHRGVNK